MTKNEEKPAQATAESVVPQMEMFNCLECEETFEVSGSGLDELAKHCDEKKHWKYGANIEYVDV